MSVTISYTLGDKVAMVSVITVRINRNTREEQAYGRKSSRGCPDLTTFGAILRIAVWENAAEIPKSPHRRLGTAVAE
ncbi:MAG: hypothetical protein KDN22_27020 [Verrucomicrobiae bacterium]|nr:hypothetical protein [Verrucomicrobiae bacterium]